MVITADTAKQGDAIKVFGRRAVVTRIEDNRIYFRYILKGQPSKTERNVGSAERA